MEKREEDFKELQDN